MSIGIYDNPSGVDNIFACRTCADKLGIRDRYLDSADPGAKCDECLTLTTRTPLEQEAFQLVHQLWHGSGPLANLRPEDVVDIVVSHAPYGVNHRDAFFRRLREETDRRHPSLWA